MTSLRIHKTASPSAIGAPILPMSAEDARFWHLFNARRASTKASSHPVAVVAAQGRGAGR